MVFLFLLVSSALFFQFLVLWSLCHGTASVSSLSFFLTWGGSFSLSRDYFVGRRVLVQRPKMRCAGELCMFSVGVFLQLIKVRVKSSSLFLVFFRRRLAILMALSTLPLLCGYSGELNVCSNLYALANSAISLGVKGGPWFLWTITGIPCVAKCLLRTLIVGVRVAAALSVCILSSSK